MDDKPLAEYNIDEKTGFIVVMITKVIKIILAIKISCLV